RLDVSTGIAGFDIGEQTTPVIPKAAGDGPHGVDFRPQLHRVDRKPEIGDGLFFDIRAGKRSFNAEDKPASLKVVTDVPADEPAIRVMAQPVTCKDDGVEDISQRFPIGISPSIASMQA